MRGLMQQQPPWNPRVQEAQARADRVEAAITALAATATMVAWARKLTGVQRELAVEEACLRVDAADAEYQAALAAWRLAVPVSMPPGLASGVDGPEQPHG